MKGVLLAGLAALSYTSYILYGNFIIKEMSYQVTVAYVCLFSAISFLILGGRHTQLVLSRYMFRVDVALRHRFRFPEKRGQNLVKLINNMLKLCCNKLKLKKKGW